VPILGDKTWRIDPIDLAYDSKGSRLFVADNGRGRVLVFDGSKIKDDMKATYVLGQKNLAASSSNMTASGLSGVSKVAFDGATNRLFVLNSGPRISVYDVSTIKNGMPAVAVLGQPNFSSEGMGTGEDRFGWVTGIACEPAHNRLFVTDSSNDRILIFDTTTIVNGMKAINVLGKTDFDKSPEARP
jgi:DNA-binding beta-propeller fold protein YncE